MSYEIESVKNEALTVAQLMEYLSDCDPESIVVLAAVKDGYTEAIAVSEVVALEESDLHEEYRSQTRVGVNLEDYDDYDDDSSDDSVEMVVLL